MNVTQQVESILRHSDRARNSDRELLLIFMQKSGMDLSEAQIATFRDMPELWTVRRLRQKFQEDGLFLPSEAVGRARRLKSYAVQQNAPNAKPETMERLIEDSHDVVVQVPEVQQLLNWIDGDS